VHLRIFAYLPGVQLPGINLSAYNVNATVYKKPVDNIHASSQKKTECWYCVVVVVT